MTLRYAHLSPRYLADEVKALDPVQQNGRPQTKSDAEQAGFFWALCAFLVEVAFFPDLPFFFATWAPRRARAGLFSGFWQLIRRCGGGGDLEILSYDWLKKSRHVMPMVGYVRSRLRQMKGHGSKFGRKKEEAIAALLTQRNLEEAVAAPTGRLRGDAGQ